MTERNAAVAELYGREARKMWRALIGYTGNVDAADDAVAEAFARALHYADGVRDLSAWTWRVAFRVAARDAQRQLPLAMADAARAPDESVPDLVWALRQLPPKQRLAVVLGDYADRPVREVAAVLECSTATVYVHLSTGRRRLRELLEVTDAR